MHTFKIKRLKSNPEWYHVYMGTEVICKMNTWGGTILCKSFWNHPAYVLHGDEFYKKLHEIVETVKHHDFIKFTIG